MRIEIRSDECVVIDGYVNAVDRDSRPIITAYGKVVERIVPNAFRTALKRAENVDLLLDHDEERHLGSTKETNLKLYEDNIGLRAICTINDKEVVQKAKNNKLRGWSWGMYVNSDELEKRADDIPRRIVKDLDIFEVSIIDEKMNPCYIGTSIETRADDKDVVVERRSIKTQNVVENMVETPKESYYEDYQKRIDCVSESDTEGE